MAIQRVYHCFVEDMACGVHDLRHDVLKVALCNVRPDVAADVVLDDVGEIEPGFGYQQGGQEVLRQEGARQPGVFSLQLAPVVFQALGEEQPEGTVLIGPFQWVVLYNASKRINARGQEGHPLICAWEYRKEIDLAHEETFVWRAPKGQAVFRLSVPGT